MPNYRLILCPVDFSRPSERAFETAIDLASRLGSEITVVHVYQLSALELSDVAADGLAELTRVVEERLRAKLDAFVEELPAPGVKVSTGLYEGVPYVEITRAAKQLGADLIVIGTHGRTGLAHMMLGSVAERVVRTSDVPVLTVRAR